MTSFPAGLTTIFTDSLSRSPWGWALLVTVLGMLIKVWPVINEQILKARANKLAGRRSDMDVLRDRVNALEGKVETAQLAARAAHDATHSVETKLVSALAAFRLVAGELQKHDPNNPVLKQAMDLMGLAATDDFGVGKAFEKIALMPMTRKTGTEG